LDINADILRGLVMLMHFAIKIDRYNLKKVTMLWSGGLLLVNVATFSVLWFVVRGNSKNVYFSNILVELFNK
jgi:hypothetical protein